MATPPKRDDGPPGGDESLRLFADDIEQSFNKIEQSLTDTRTAATFLKALDVWERVLQGSHATGHLGDEEAAKLLETLGWMRQAPRLV